MPDFEKGNLLNNDGLGSRRPKGLECDPKDPNVWCQVIGWALAILFASLFGVWYSRWDVLDHCASRRIVTDGPYNASKHCLTMSTEQGLQAMPSGTCPHECDRRLYDAHAVAAAQGRRLQSFTVVNGCRENCRSRLNSTAQQTNCTGDTSIENGTALKVCENACISRWDSRSRNDGKITNDTYAHRPDCKQALLIGNAHESSFINDMQSPLYDPPRAATTTS